MAIIIAIIIFVGTLFLIYQFYKFIKEKNERDEELITIDNFASVQFVDNEFTVGEDAEENAKKYIDIISEDGLSYHNHEEEDWLQSYNYDELFEMQEESANRISNEMLDDIINSDEESDNSYDDEIDYFDEEEFLSQFDDIETEELNNESRKVF